MSTFNIKQLEQAFSDSLSAIGEDLSSERLKKTPERAARAFAFFNEGYQKTVEEAVGTAIYPSYSEGMICIREIEFYSLCEHHLVPFFGSCSIAYLPNKKILGISKFARIVNLYCRRLQIQERLVREIASAIDQVLSPRGVGVIIEARHLCMSMRGVEKQRGDVQTEAFLGELCQEERKREFLIRCKK